ncbi:hypothetical protein PUN28_010777 [Cardiocondyla obscurior]|uniref:Uncharacterized protein n=1 Tax=Cardiocondyla obscurior TaxID=286306 RepID=A0AAW2FKD4_9HYME
MLAVNFLRDILGLGFGSITERARARAKLPKLLVGQVQYVHFFFFFFFFFNARKSLYEYPRLIEITAGGYVGLGESSQYPLFKNLTSGLAQAMIGGRHGRHEHITRATQGTLLLSLSFAISSFPLLFLPLKRVFRHGGEQLYEDPNVP